MSGAAAELQFGRAHCRVMKMSELRILVASNGLRDHSVTTQGHWGLGSMRATAMAAGSARACGDAASGRNRRA